MSDIVRMLLRISFLILATKDPVSKQADVQHCEWL